MESTSGSPPHSTVSTGIIKRKIQPANLMLGAAVSMFEITTLGQPLEVLKTHLAAHRDCRIPDAIAQVWSRGGFKGFYQGMYLTFFLFDMIFRSPSDSSQMRRHSRLMHISFPLCDIVNHVRNSIRVDSMGKRVLQRSCRSGLSLGFFRQPSVN